MIIEKLVTNKIPYVVIDDFYTEEELTKIWIELEYLTPNLLSVDETNAAHDNGVLKTSKRGAFLDQIYGDRRNFSHILTLNRKQFSADVMEELENYHPWFRYLSISDHDSTLLSYYEASDYYKAHRDSAMLTTLHWFYKEPKSFEGGDLMLEHDSLIECRNNRVVYIPSVADHEVIPISMKDEDKDKGLGRYCISTFISHRGN